MINRRSLVPEPKALGRCETKCNKKHIDETAAKLLGYYNDPEKQQRRAAALCKYHFYFMKNRVGGCAMTTVNCRICDQDITFGSTCTDDYCQECALEYGVCKRCGATLD